MSIITKYCCCFEVRTGAYVIAILSVFRGIVFLSWLCYGFLYWFIGMNVIRKALKKNKMFLIYKAMKSSLNEQLDLGNLLRNIENCSSMAVVQVY